MGAKKTDHDMRATPMWAKAMIVLALAGVLFGTVYVLVLMPVGRRTTDTVSPLPNLGR